MLSLERTIKYPVTRKVDQIDDYHGTKVADPYRWLEEIDSEETKAWVKAQNEVTFTYLDQIPAREKIRQRLTEVWDYEKFEIPFKYGERYFYFKNDGLQNQKVLYTLTSLDAEPTVLFDPNILSKDGTIALTDIAISQDGKFMAYGLCKSGSDWQEWKIRNVETGEDLDDHIKWVKFSGVAWTHDNQGFFYSRFDEPNEETKLEEVNYCQKLYYHRMGTPQSEDILIYDRPDQKEWGFSPEVTDDGNYLLITVWRGTVPQYMIFYKDLTQPDSPVVELIGEFEANYTLIANEGTTFWFYTDLNAPRSRVIAIDLNHPRRENWREIIPESEEALQSVSLVNNQFIGIYWKDACNQVKIFDINGKFVREVELPGIGTVSGFKGKRSKSTTFYMFTSFTTPRTIYRYDMISGASTIFRQPKVDFNPDNYETKQIFYSSKDGTQVPMFIYYKKGLQLNGNNPTYLIGYGGFNVSFGPQFLPSQLVWMDLGGVVALPNLRGGGEYGKEWHQAAFKEKKQNVFDDFIAAAEWLIANKYTCPAKLGIIGSSNGGLLVGACMIQRPDLFGAAIASVPLMDMLRFHKFTIGWAWCCEYGSPDIEEEFDFLYAYSPLHNIKSGVSYPATLITTGDHDDRVIPAHSYKFAAALQEAQAGDQPILIRVATKVGHGPGKPTSKIIAEKTDKWSFLVHILDVPVN